MGLRQLSIKAAYSSDSDDVLNEFYLPALAEATEYRRLAGFFSSSSLAIAARGISEMITRGGRILLICSPLLSKEDLEAVQSASTDSKTLVTDVLLRELDPSRLSEAFERDHVFALAWLLANKRLEMRIAVPADDRGNLLTASAVRASGMFHQKVGVLLDGADAISFSGSINETASGWTTNVEEFKVFRSWDPREAEYQSTDLETFDRLWNNESPRCIVTDLPKAVADHMVKIAPAHPPIEHLRSQSKRKSKPRIALYQHQWDAVSAWEAAGRRGVLEMATGTGKTFTALGCVAGAQESLKKLITVVSCPYGHLVEQWRREIEQYGLTADMVMVADSTNPNWKNDLANCTMDVRLGYKRYPIILTTHTTLSSEDFGSIFGSATDASSTLLVGDEVHGLGAPKMRRGLGDWFSFRLGLSATPRRWFDDDGTQTVFDFFGGVVYEFGLERALYETNPATGQSYLTPFVYVPELVNLSVDEARQYADLSIRIARTWASTKSKNMEESDGLRMLLFKRANIIKNAGDKERALRATLSELGPRTQHLIVYCSPQQIDHVMQIVNEQQLTAHRFTMKEGTKPDPRYGNRSQRGEILHRFGEGTFQVLVAMKCLDEGVDVPPAHRAILMASSGNPREHIQRIGRIVRRYAGKSIAHVHDFIVAPLLDDLPPDVRNFTAKAVAREIDRFAEIAKLAINNVDALEMLSDVKERYLEVQH